MTRATIDLSRINANYSLLSKCNFVIPVLKSDAYGHGLFAVADRLFSVGARLFAVFDENEATVLLSRLTSAEALILGGYASGLPKLLQARAIYAVSSLWDAARIPTEDAPTRVHIALNTGMNRMGFSLHPDDLDATLAAIRSLLTDSHLRVTGIYTHLPVPPNDPHFLRMKHRLHVAVARILSLSPDLLVHAAATPTLNGDILPPDLPHTAVRAGLALYGYGTGGVLPAMTVEAPVIGRFRVRKGESIGYGADFTAVSDTETAVVAVGYADGLPRLHHGVCLYKGRRLPVYGRVSMNLTVIGGEFLPTVGEYVTLFGDGYTAHDLARDTHSIPYELLLMGSRAHRRYTNGTESGSSPEKTI